jgi:hypothetical protein
VNELAKAANQTPHDWVKTRRHARSDIRPPEWPKNVQAISVNGLSLLGIDDRNRLYWDGQRITTFTLSAWQKAGAVVLTVSAAVAALAAVASAAADWRDAWTPHSIDAPVKPAK